MDYYPNWLHCVVLAVFLMLCSVGTALASSPSCMVDLLMGEPIPMETLLDDLAQVRVVYVGEIHTIARHHELQAAILQGLAARNPKLALGMEMFTQEQQPILDRWQKGNEDISALMRDLGGGRWTNLNDYRSVLLAARRLHVPIKGLNASDILVHKVAMAGLDKLTPEERKAVPSDLKKNINPLNDRLLRLRLRVHKAFQGMGLDRIVLAQALRDQTMAAGVVRFLKSPQGSDRIMMVIAGNGHVNYGFGIPEAVKRGLDVPSRIVMASESGELVLSKKEQRQAVPIDITHQDLRFIRVPLADYLQVAPLPDEESI